MAIAPYVKRDSYIDMKDEDDNMWRWEFDGKECIKDEDALIFDESDNFFTKIKEWFSKLFQK